MARECETFLGPHQFCGVQVSGLMCKGIQNPQKGLVVVTAPDKRHTYEGPDLFSDTVVRHLDKSLKWLCEQTDFDFTVGQCLVSDKSNAC